MRSVLVLVMILSVSTLFSCNEFDYQGRSQVIQDSLVNVLPRWQSVKIKIGDNNTSMLIVVGDATFYKAPDDIKREKAAELGKMVLRIYGPGNYLEKGNLIITADIHNTSETPPDGITMPIDFLALKKDMGNK